MKEVIITDKGNSDAINRAYLHSMTLEHRLVGSETPDTGFGFYGHNFSTPIMAGGFAHYGKLHESGAVGFGQSVKAAGSVLFTGNLRDNEFAEILEQGISAVRIIKPYADKEKVLAAIRHDKRHGALAIAMDIDHGFGQNGEYDSFGADRLKPPSAADLREFSSQGLPFIAKGVLSARDAALCAESGVSGIIVSHHKNMFPWSVPPLRILPEIKKTANGRLNIYIDCNIESGFDAFKALALGADGVCVARPLMNAFKGQGADGATKLIDTMTAELRCAMAITGAKRICEIDPAAIHFKEA
jgi:isopentenyl diphosphate isomerase/L-lactate dehydrogenase-like FMN-dependent dehydrogenase